MVPHASIDVRRPRIHIVVAQAAGVHNRGKLWARAEVLAIAAAMNRLKALRNVAAPCCGASWGAPKTTLL